MEHKAMDDIEKMLIDIKTDVSALKTDCMWMKRLFATSLVIVGTVFGIDMSGVV